MYTNVFGDTETISMDRRVLQVNLLVKIQAKVTSDAPVFFVELVPYVFQLLRELFEILVVLWLDDEVVVFQFVKVQSILDHVSVF